nr:unnamed protein product [Callosobruchus chinensis]
MVSVQKSEFFIDGLKHVFEFFRLLPENSLLSMIDERAHIRELGYRRIIEGRTLASKIKSIRRFQSPKLNFQASEYIEMIDWITTTTSSPSLPRKVWTKITSSDTAKEWNFDNFPCHTQAVERFVKLVTEASQKIVGFKNGDAFIKSTVISRGVMPVFDSNIATPKDK